MSTGDPWCKIHGFMGEIKANPADKVFLLAERSMLLKDVERINWLEKQLAKKIGSGKCAFRWSISGRGFRLHEMSDLAAKMFNVKSCTSVREAIDRAMRRENDESNRSRIADDPGRERGDPGD